MSAALLAGLVVASMMQSTPDLTTAKGCVDAIHSQLDTLQAKSQPKLYAWHLRSLRSLVDAEFTKLSFESKPQAEKDFVEYAARIATGLERDCNTPELYLEQGRRTLVLARLSKIEGSLQYAMVDLPEHWDPNRAYPLYVGLHGHGPESPLAYPSFGFGPADPKSSPRKDAIGLTPWGRGNRGWQGDAERDLFEALDDLHSFAKTDRDHWYLTGHSSGGDGCWAIVNRTPDLWAAAGVQSGSMLSAEPNLGLLPNIVHVPIHVLVGELEADPRRVSDAKRMHEMMQKQHGTSKLVIMPKIGHYPLDPVAVEEQSRWLSQFTRKRPDSFTFAIDRAEHPGVWGISAPLNPWTDRTILYPWPTISCETKGDEVRIKTTGMKSVKVDFRPGGFDWKGAIKLYVNGKLVHEGDAPSGQKEYTL